MAEIDPGEQTPDIILTVDHELSFGDMSNKEVVTYSGQWDAICEFAAACMVGSYELGDVESNLPDGGSETSGNEFASPYFSAVTCKRRQGGIGLLQVTLSQLRNRCSFGIDWVEVSKPIQTWHADAGTSAPNLDQIRRWEQQKDSNPALYAAFKIGTETLEGDTLRLAEFIYKGIESYPRYAPAVTITLKIKDPNRAGDYSKIGTVGTPEAPFGWNDVGGNAIDEMIGIFGGQYQWLLVKSVLSPNSDGSFTWNICWQGADSIDGYLYEQTQVDGGDTP